MPKDRQPENLRDAAEFLSKLDQITVENADLLDELERRMPAPGYAIPMIVDCAEVQANSTVDHVAPWGFADFSALFRDMLNLLHRTAAKVLQQDQDFQLFFNSAQQLDSNVQSYLAYEHMSTVFLNEKITIGSNLKHVTKDGARYRLSLADSRRRSAISLLRHKALFLRHSKKEQELLSLLPKRKMESEQDKHQERLLELVFELDLSEIDILRKGLPDTWKQLTETVGVEDTDIVTFLAFTTALSNVVFRWLQSDTLYELLSAFAPSYERKSISREKFDILLNLFSSDLKQAQRVGTAVPFLKIGSWYRYWPFAYHIMLPELVLVTVLQQKHESTWSKTFGSDMAKVADAIASQLPQLTNISIATCKIKQGVGDIDLAVYDGERKHLLICEVKTVFDKFRTDFQSRNFINQKVNFDKAFGQLDVAYNAIESGAWSLKDIFGDVDSSPVRIFRLVLVWRDHANPSLDTGDYTPVSDFASFLYLYEQCAGDLQLLIESVEQFEKIYMVSTHVDDFLPTQSDNLLFSREKEIGALPPLDHFKERPLTAVVRKEIASLPHLPKDWKQQQSANGDNQVYLFKDGFESR